MIPLIFILLGISTLWLMKSIIDLHILRFEIGLREKEDQFRRKIEMLRSMR